MKGISPINRSSRLTPKPLFGRVIVRLRIRCSRCFFPAEPRNLLPITGCRMAATPVRSSARRSSPSPSTRTANSRSAFRRIQPALQLQPAAIPQNSRSKALQVFTIVLPADPANGHKWTLAPLSKGAFSKRSATSFSPVPKATNCGSFAPRRAAKPHCILLMLGPQIRLRMPNNACSSQFESSSTRIHARIRCCSQAVAAEVL